MRKQERDLYYSQMDNILPILSAEDQGKMEFVKSFLGKEFQVDDFEDSLIMFERMGTKSLLYFLFAMIVEYDNSIQM
jgi:hypothetical protein